MSHTSQVVIQNLTYNTPDNKSIFNDLTLSFGGGKTAIIGKNGSGKTTLVKLMVGELLPTLGSVRLHGTAAVCPQDLKVFSHNTIADVFNVTAKLDALASIIAGSVNVEDFTVLDEDWQVEQRIQSQLNKFGLEQLSMRRRLDTLSGGEITRLWLAKVFATNADFLILDEPTNNLDIITKQLFYEQIENYKGSLIIISHDRQLLTLMQQIVDITTLGVKTYSGNYLDYLEQRETERAAKERQLADAKKALQKTQASIQTTREKRTQRESQGVRLRKSGGQAKIILDGMQQRAEQTQGKLATREEHMLDKAQKDLTSAKANVEIVAEIKLKLPKTKVPNGKMVVNLEEVGFSYPDNINMLIDKFNFTIVGPKRIALIGANGCGKTALVKLITGELVPVAGKVTRGVDSIKYLDQHASLLEPQLSILDNFKKFNPQVKETEAHLSLARFLFRNQDALKLVANLSSGEKTRVLLASILLAEQPPQLLILDEPTNHLDLASIVAIEEALNCYEGALLVISHDENFIANVSVTEIVKPPFVGRV